MGRQRHHTLFVFLCKPLNLSCNSLTWVLFPLPSTPENAINNPLGDLMFVSERPLVKLLDSWSP